MSPAAPRKPCRTCGKLANGSYCEEHLNKKQVEQKQERIRYDNSRGTAASRGYDSRWSRYSKQYRINRPLCVMCEKQGKLTLAECVDHIEPVDGPDDPMFWVESNHQGLCNTCHNLKSEAEGNRFGNKKQERFI